MFCREAACDIENNSFENFHKLFKIYIMGSVFGKVKGPYFRGNFLIAKEKLLSTFREFAVIYYEKKVCSKQKIYGQLYFPYILYNIHEVQGSAK